MKLEVIKQNFVDRLNFLKEEEKELKKKKIELERKKEEAVEDYLLKLHNENKIYYPYRYFNKRKTILSSEMVLIKIDFKVESSYKFFEGFISRYYVSDEGNVYPKFKRATIKKRVSSDDLKIYSFIDTNSTFIKKISWRLLNNSKQEYIIDNF